MKKIRIILAVLLLISVATAGCLESKETEMPIHENEIKESYILNEIAPNVIFVEVIEKDHFETNPSISIKEALKNIATTHTIKSCVAVQKYSGHGSKTASIIVFVEPKETSVS